VDAAGKAVNFSVSEYNKVYIGNFAGDSSATKFKGKTQEIIDNKRKAFEDQAAQHGAEFAQILATEIRSRGVFEEVIVSDDATDEKALLVEGVVKRFKQGNAAARLLIGFGAGSSNFDADVYIKDLSTGDTIGTVIVDKNSWALGGAVAMTQDMRSHMVSAAKKIAADLEKAKIN